MPKTCIEPATMKKSSTRLTRELAAAVVDMQCVVRIEAFDDGVEIRDSRPLAERIEAPVEGAGVIRYFGDTHFIVTEALARRLNAKSLPTTIQQ